MNAGIRRLLAMAARMLDFVRAQPASTDPGFLALVSALEKLVARGDELAGQQADGVVVQASAVRRRRDLRRRTIRKRVQYLVSVAERGQESAPEVAQQFAIPPAGGPLKDFIVAVKRMLAAAALQKDLLVSLGLGATFLDDLTAEVAKFDDATERAHDGQRDHVGASAELASIGREVRRVAKALDGWYQVQFADDVNSLAAWQTARNVVGPFRHDAHEPEPSPAPSPSPAPVQQSAGRAAAEKPGQDTGDDGTNPSGEASRAA